MLFTQFFVFIGALGIIHISQVSAQSTGQITQIAEEVVRMAGATGVLNCTVSAPMSERERIIVEWQYLNATGGPRTITQGCIVIEQNNVFSGKEKYELVCVDNQVSHILYSLRVNMLSMTDNGWYECRARVSNSDQPTSKMPVKLTVLSPPKVKAAATSLTVDAFAMDTVVLTCSAEGVPAPNVTWGRANGKPLPVDRAKQPAINKTSEIVTVQNLTIENVTKEDTGTYRCSADNNIRPPDEFYAKVSVQYKPSVAPVEPSYGTPTGENTQVMLWCKVDGNPRPTMLWYAMTQDQSTKFADGIQELDDEFFAKAGELRTDEKYKIEQKIMTVGSLSTMESMFYTLTLRTVTPGDMVYYVCRAANKHGTAATAVQLYRINTFADTNSGAGEITLSVSMLILNMYLFLWR